MDSPGNDVESTLRNLQAQAAQTSEETRLMRESLRAQQADLEAKERELVVQKREKDLYIALKEAEEILVVEFLQADANNNFEDHNAMMYSIIALITLAAGAGGPDGGANEEDD